MMKRYIKRHFKSGIALFSALLIGLVLLVAAYGKLFYPTPALEIFDRTIGFLEFIFLVILILFRTEAVVWLVASIIFASWGGYALFWHLSSVPCGCMGGAVHIPSSLSLSIDGLFWILSLTVAQILGSPKRKRIGACLIGVVTATMGFFAAKVVYQYWMSV